MEIFRKGGGGPTQSITLLHIFFVYQSYGILGEKDTFFTKKFF